MTAPQLSFKALRRVVIAAAVGNVIEWYDFYIFGSLAAILSVQFFAQGTSGAALIKTVGTFTAGFLIRPFGAFLFGRIGDLVGRKYTFLITLSGMGLSTALIGLVPSYAKIGALAGVLLLLLRLIQGLCQPQQQQQRSEEHTSELQSPCNLVCRLLLEKKKKTDIKSI